MGGAAALGGHLVRGPLKAAWAPLAGVTIAVLWSHWSHTRTLATHLGPSPHLQLHNCPVESGRVQDGRWRGGGGWARAGRGEYLAREQ
eukprot:3536787-Alexandrium_andersonii.AAC.1